MNPTIDKIRSSMNGIAGVSFPRVPRPPSTPYQSADGPAPARAASPLPDGWRASTANHLLTVDLPGIGMSRTLGVEIYVADEIAQFVLNLDSMMLARTEITGADYAGPDAATYRAAALAWAVQTLGAGVMLPLERAACEARIDAEALRIVREHDAPDFPATYDAQFADVGAGGAVMVPTGDAPRKAPKKARKPVARRKATRRGKKAKR